MVFHQGDMVSAGEIEALFAEARAAWSLEVGDVAARAGLDLDATECALRGEADASDLDPVARALGGSLDDLLDGRRFWAAPAVALETAPATMELPVVRAAVLRISTAMRDRIWLGSLLGISPASHSRPASLEPVACGEQVTDQAEALALLLRTHLGNELEPIASVREVLLRLGVATFLTDLGTEAVNGVLWRDGSHGACAAANIQARGSKSTAIRMTFAHELCHLLFDGTKLAPLGLVERRSPLADGLEQRADAFAAHFLAPRRAVDLFLRQRGLSVATTPTASHVRAVSAHFGMGVEAVAAHFISLGLWSRTEMLRHRYVSTPDVHCLDTIELLASQAESQVPLERRGEILDLATIALDQGEISVARWRTLVRLDQSHDWRRVLSEREVSVDVEHRSM
jgi:hypothetical protein